MVNRRKLLIVLGVGAFQAWARATNAQPSAKVPRVGVLDGAPPSAFLEAFKQGLRERGYIEGKSIALEYRSANGKLPELPKLAAELVRLNVDVVLAGTTPAAVAARDATNTIPIVFATVADPVGVKLVASLPRPGGNVTGLTTNNTEVAGKRLQILKEMSGGKASRVAVLFNPADASNVLGLKALEDPARKLGITLRPLPVKGPEEFEGAFSAIAPERMDSIFVFAGVLTDAHARRIAELVATARLPAIYGSEAFVEAGGLMSYSAVFSDNYRRAAYVVDRILKGTKPADLPIEQPMTFAMAVNLKSAKGLGITVPQTILLQATRLIE
jgi:putative ABC transport system substrate-binding protein